MLIRWLVKALLESKKHTVEKLSVAVISNSPNAIKIHVKKVINVFKTSPIQRIIKIILLN